MNDVVEVALAGLLHDWGKLLQRAEAPLSESAQKMTEMLCPVYQGRHSHRHVLWTNDCLSSAAGWIPTDLDLPKIVGLASRHHRPSETLDHIVTEADRLASGHDRREQAEVLENFKAVPLQSAVGRLKLSEDLSVRRAVYLPAALEAGPGILPQPPATPRSLVPEYRSVERVLREALNSIHAPAVTRICDTLGHLSELTLATIPASTIDEFPDVSLHDHSRLVAALSAALYVFHRDTNTMTESAIRDRTTPKFIFVTGDLSGIQDYLFAMPQVGARGVARALRARSFLLSMLTHAAALKLLSSASAVSFNRILDAGGRFQLLLANTPQVRAAVASAGREIDAWMLQRYGGRLALNIDADHIASGADFIGSGAERLFRSIQTSADAAKKRRFRAELQIDRRWCTSAAKLAYVNQDQRARDVLEADRQLGRALPDARFVGLWLHDAPTGLLDEPVELLGYQAQLFGGEVSSTEYGNAADFFAIAPDEARSIPRRIVANYVPRLSIADCERLRHDDGISPAGDDDEHAIPDRLATFEHLALLARSSSTNNAPRSRGFAGLACIKADVDRLGMLLSHGCGADVSLGRIAGISRQLDLFFKGFLTNRFSSPDSIYRHVYTIFAGGDDLLLVGPWPVMLDLAADIRTWFGRFTAGNPDVTLSAGISLGAARTPVSLLAGAANEHLDAAKNAGRDRVGIFRDTFTWSDYTTALEMGKRLDNMLMRADADETGLALPSGFVYRLLQYAKMAARVDEARQAASRGDGVRLRELRAELTWRSHLAYDLDRNVRRPLNKNPPLAALEDLQWLESTFVTQMKPGSARLLKLAATYALYRNRGA